MKKLEEKINQKDLTFRAGKYKYDFQQFKKVRSFVDSIYTGKINIDEAEMDQTNLLKNMVKFNDKLNQKKDKEKKYF